ncbi:putative Ig domain-containing protein [Embleya sp. NPDC008237]|uniref:putative Ig domain-containing protein n=1 Tax=Embleya sp. NPDC008237 TaxID=3363978 RepID=UPI0036E6ECB7
MHSAIRRRIRPGALGAGLLATMCALAALAPAAVAGAGRPEAVRARPAAPTAPGGTTQVQTAVTGNGDHRVTVPVGATAMTVTVYGKAAGTVPGSSVAGSAAIAAAGPVRSGATLVVGITDSGTTLSSATAPLPWLFAPAAGGIGAYADPIVFPGAQTSATGGVGDGHALLSFTVPAAQVGDLLPAVDFGTSPVGQKATRNLPITVTADVPFMIASAKVDGPFAIDAGGTTCASGPDTNVPGGSACSFAITFTPTKRGSAAGTLTLTGNIPGGSRTVTLSGVGSGKPGAPGGLAATAGQGQAVLSWMPPADTGDSPITGYRILRSTNGEPKSASPLATLGADTLTYADQSLDNGTTYSYAITALNAVGESDPSAPVDVLPSAALVLPAAVLPHATVGQPYTAKLAAQGGTAPYHWVADDPLPPGLTLDPDSGVITGTPTAPGETGFGITVSDNAPTRHEAKARFGITVTAPAAASAGSAQAALAPGSTGGDGGSNVSTWLWGILGLLGLIGVVVAVRLLRARQG